MIEIINKLLLLHLVGYLYYWQMRFNSVFKGLKPLYITNSPACRKCSEVLKGTSIAQMLLCRPNGLLPVQTCCFLICKINSQLLEELWRTETGCLVVACNKHNTVANMEVVSNCVLTAAAASLRSAATSYV